MNQKIIIMGVSGSGKSTIGVLLADELGSAFYDGDDFHPQANVDKMEKGIPLNDSDRQPWLEALRDKLAETSEVSVTACSALRRCHRDLLREAGDLTFVYLRGDEDILRQRLEQRSNISEHFMPVNLLESQLATLEEPTIHEGVQVVPITDTPEQIVSTVKNALLVK